MSGPDATIDVDFFDPATNHCPYHAYATLRDQGPVWHDPRTGMYVITRYEDVRAILLDTVAYPSQRRGRRRGTPEVMARAEAMQALYREKGWVPAPTLANRDDPEHKQMRALFDHAFRPSRIKALDGFVSEVAHRLIDSFAERGSCDWVSEFAVPLPLTVIGQQMGAPEEDIWRIKAWTDAWVQRLGMMQTADEERWSVEMEIEAQHYFQAIFDKLRKHPDETLISDLVNTPVPGWDRTLTDEELHAEMMADTFVGGSETSTNALSAGVMLLLDNPDTWSALQSDPDRNIPLFVEEVVRLEGPVQGLFRTASRDIELHGVLIPAGALINIRYAAANRDERHFERADQIDLEREGLRSHLAFGFGTHHCLGAPLARRELILGFAALVDRLDNLAYEDPGQALEYQANFCLRALKSLPITFTVRA
jgi:cytochrome P450